jgi:hypothetical protein
MAFPGYVKSQAHEGWRALSARYDDGGFSGGSMDRPALQRLLADIRAGLVDVVVVYKVDRLTRSLSDFVELFEAEPGPRRYRGPGLAWTAPGRPWAPPVAVGVTMAEDDVWVVPYERGLQR